MSLAEQYHVIALDQRGHGDSPFAENYPLLDYVDDIRAVLDGLDLRDVVLIGHSAGSKNAWLSIGRYPGRVSQLVITDMDPDGHNPGSIEMITRYKYESDEYENFEAVVERIASRQPNSSLASIRYAAQVMTRALPDGRFIWKRDRNVVLKYDRPDVWDSLSQVHVPTLIIRGAESTLLRAEVAERMVQEIPNCSLIELPGGGHWVHLERPESYLEAVRSFVEANR